MKCSFCGTNFEAGRGMMFVKADGKVLYFCKRKCEKNTFKLGRLPKNVEWTETARKDKQDRIKHIQVNKKA